MDGRDGGKNLTRVVALSEVGSFCNVGNFTNYFYKDSHRW